MTTPSSLLRHGAAALCLAAAPALAQPAWIATWTASPQPTWGSDFVLPVNVPASLADQTVRQVARIGPGGRRVRLVLSNAYGRAPLAIGGVRIALAGPGSAIVAGTDHPVAFGGQASVSVPPGAPMVSDAIDLELPALARVSVSIWLRERAETSTFHWDGRASAWIVDGDRTAAPALPGPATTTARLLLGEIQVEADDPAGAVVAIGDSITDGATATLDADTRWPDFLAARLAPARVAVLNAGISGGRLLHDGMGVNALARFDRDVLARPGVRSVVVLLGINDIAWPGTAFEPAGRRPSLAEMVDGYRQLIARAHARGVRIVGATLTPFEGALPGTPLDDYYAAAKDALRRAVNDWIRDGGEFDAVADFDALLRDPAHPGRMRGEFDSGDHLHPGDRGNAAMAGALTDALLFGAPPGPQAQNR